VKPIVVVETPFAGDVARNLRFARACLRDCLLRGETPYASHLLLTQPGVLDDGVDGDRKLGMEAGFEFKNVADCTVVYTNLGISPGMQAGIDASLAKGYRYEFRELPHDWEARALEFETTFRTRWPSSGPGVEVCS
jgi:hypothetical protein